MKYDYPDKEGNICIYPEINEGRFVNVNIIGDPEGLRYLAKLLNYIAGIDQDENNDPIGEREHIHIHPEMQLDEHSCEVEICRADAKGTGEFPDFMKE